MKSEIEKSAEGVGEFALVPCTTIIADINGNIYEQSADCMVVYDKDKIRKRDKIGQIIKCKNSENGICGESPTCEKCEIRKGIGLVLESKKKRSISIVKELIQGKSALLDVDIVPFGSTAGGKVFITIAERDSTYMKIFLEDRENYQYEDFFYSNLDKLNLLIWSCDLNGKMRNMSSSLLELLGITKEEMVQGKWKESISIDFSKISSVILSQNGSYEVETKIIDFDGEPRWLLVRISEHTDHEGRVDGYIGKCTDITTLKMHQLKIDEKIRESEIIKKNTDEFIAKLSHEVRTPLNGIMGMSELLIRTHLNTEQEEDVTIIKSSALNMLRLVNDMLDMTRIESGKISLVTTKFNIELAIKDIVKSLEGQAKQKGLNLISEFDLKGRDVVIGDPDRIRQVISNLVFNAIKFTHPGGRITVRLSNSRNKLMEAGMYTYHFEVEDTGIGIPKDDVPRLFKNYSQLSTSIQGNNSGLGLGLAISKGLVEIMGGEIWVKSKVGKGACFVFELPLMCSKALDETMEEQPERIIEAGMKALVAEDNEMNRFVIEKLLEGLKYEVEVVENGYVALKAFREKSYDIVFMDVQMPIMDGIETTKKIREMEKGQEHIPIIAVTAFAIKGDREKFIEAGMDGYISKPISLVDLKEEIHRVNHLLHKDRENLLLEAEVGIEQNYEEERPESASAELTNQAVSDLLIGLSAALESENEFAAESIVLQLKEMASDLKNAELKDKLLKIAMSYRAGNYSKAIDYLK